jgi:hypothetical protein
MLHLNGWFGEIRCSAKRLLLHVQRDAAPAKAKNNVGFVRRAALWVVKSLHK